MRITNWSGAAVAACVLIAGGCAREADWREHFSDHPALVAAVPAGATVLSVRQDQFEGSGEMLVEARLRLPPGAEPRAWLRGLEAACRRRGQRVEVSPDRVDLFDPSVSVVYRPSENAVLLVRSVSRE